MQKIICCCFLFTTLDINECDSNTHGCSTNAHCTNTVGSYFCTCISNYHGNGKYCVYKRKFFLNLVPRIFSAFNMATGLLEPDKTLRKRSFSPGSFSWRNWTETEHGKSNQQTRRQLLPLEKHMINKTWQVCSGGDRATQPAGFFRVSSRSYSFISRVYAVWLRATRISYQRGQLCARRIEKTKRKNNKRGKKPYLFSFLSWSALKWMSAFHFLNNKGEKKTKKIKTSTKNGN